MKNFVLFLFLFLFLTPGSLSAEGEFAVRIVDENRVPVPLVSISCFWGFNGPFPTRSNDDSESDEQWLKRYRHLVDEQMGQPVAEGKCSITDRNGCASVLLSGRAAAIAYNEDRSAGALLFPSGRYRRDAVLGELTRVTFLLDSVADTASPEWWYVQLNMPYDEERPTAQRQIGICETFSRSISLSLPVGEYEIAGLGCSKYESGIVDLRSPTALRVRIDEDTPASVEYELSLKDDPKSRQRLEKKSKAEGRWSEHESLIGKRAPTWNATDARGIALDAKPSDFQGKWLLIYFWSPDCLPCVGKSIPRLMEFWDQHAGLRDRFAVVAICYDFREELTSMKELNVRVKHIKEKVWRGRDLPFPQVLDSTFKSIERYGLSGVGNYVLVDPSGNVVDGGIEKLVEVLDRGANHSVNRSGESGGN